MCIENLEKLVLGNCNHAKNLLKHIKEYSGNNETYIGIVNKYRQYRQVVASTDDLSRESIRKIVCALNQYRAVALPVFDKLPNAGQQALGYTIMEEFFYLLFQRKMSLMNINRNNLFIGKGTSYVSLSFTPMSFNNLFEKPNTYIHTKDQDFVLGASIEINVKSDECSEKTNTIIPVVAIECKTYLEKNMLDSCAATANRLKNAMPYCMYMIAAEYMKMDEATPELTDIDEIYILCKAKNADRLRRQKYNEPPFDIDASLIIDLYERVGRHLNAIWWDPEHAVQNGKIINRPS